MIDNGYLFAKDNKRIFINTSLGCAGQCAYCYLPKMGYSNGSDNYRTISAQTIIEFIEKNKLDINQKTLITLGCYSECWDEYNKNETISLIKYFLKKGNQIQLSTKKQIMKEELTEILPLINYFGQLVIFVSSATISKHDTIEKNTTPISNRFQNFSLFNSLDIPAVLYMKPVLKGITINDLELYKKYIEKYNIKDVVVGSIFTNYISKETVHFSNKNELFYTKNSDEDMIISELSKITNVYKRSSEVMYKYNVSNHIEKVKNEVAKLLEGDNSGHGLEHINRVLDLSLKFAEKENANKYIVSLIALLHDADDYKLFGMENAEKLTNAKIIMDDCNVDKAIQEQVCDAINNIGYSKRLKGHSPTTLEGKIVSDVDMCDALGANGILRVYTYSMKNGKPFFDRNIFPIEDMNAEKYTRKCADSSVCHIFEKILKLKDLMLTDSGKEESKNRHQIVVDFLYHLFNEENAPEWIEYLNNYLKKEGITASHAPILSYLLYKDISCQEEIGNHFKIDKGSIARSIQKLQEKQFINKEIDENNRRKYQLSLTEKGRAVALKIMDLNNEWENQIYSTCNTDEKQIVELMRKITISSINIQKNTQKEEKNG